MLGSSIAKKRYFEEQTLSQMALHIVAVKEEGDATAKFEPEVKGTMIWCIGSGESSAKDHNLEKYMLEQNWKIKI